MNDKQASNIKGFTLENVSEAITGVVLISVAISASNALPIEKELFSFKALSIWVFILVFAYKGMQLIHKANKDQKIKSRHEEKI